jgi:hypothetical protein
VDIFWGDEDDESVTQGLDALGIRGVDQAHEAGLVNGITTISGRARYLSILTWAIGAYYEIEATEAGRTQLPHHSLERRNVFLNRVRFLVAVASAADDGSQGGAVLGSNDFREDIKRSAAGETIAFPSEAGAQMLNVYYGPARAMGLLKDEFAGSPIPISLTPRGHGVFSAHKAALLGTGLVELLRDGSDLSPDLIRAAIPFFSLARAGDVAGELERLREALITPWTSGGGNSVAPRVAAHYQKMIGTNAWLHDQLKVPGSPASITIANYTSCCSEGEKAVAAKEWAEAEWQRRCHYALELMLEAITDTLGGVSGHSLEEMMTIWEAGTSAETIAAFWAVQSDPWAMAARAAMETVPPDMFIDTLLPTSALHDLPAGGRVLIAFALLVALSEQAADMALSEPPEALQSQAHHTMRILAEGRDCSLRQVLFDICQDCVAVPHIANTLRKMGNGQANSLRFYTDGNQYVATGRRFIAGYSGSRLGNTMRILADVKLLRPLPGGQYALVEDEPSI